jgi:hypothetical protein
LNRLFAIFKRKPWLRKACLGLSGFAIAALLGVALFYLWMSKEDKDFVKYLNSGASINRFLKEYGNEVIAAVKSQDITALLYFYSADYHSAGRGHWNLNEPLEIHGVTHSTLEVIGSADFDRGLLEKELASYIGNLVSVERVACKINLAEEIRPGDSAQVTVKFVLDGRNKSGRVLQDRFFFRWWLRATDNGRGWEVVSEELLNDPEIFNTRVASAKRGFEKMDVRKAGIDYEHQRDPNLDLDAPGVNLKFGVVQHTFGGVSTADYNGDGLVDIFFLDGVRSRLYRHEGLGDEQSVRFEDVTEEAGLQGIDRVVCGIFADIDNDEDKDLFVSRYNASCLLYINQGDGTFEDRSRAMNLDFVGPSMSATVLDYDRDGFVDLYLAVNGDAVNEVPRIPFFARNGEPNRLFRNVDGERFEDVTEMTGVGDTGWTLAVCAGDLNNDGWMDLGVANDFGRKGIYINDGGRFNEVAKEAGTLDFSAGMGIAFGDVNNDGLFDIYTSNIYSNQRWLGEEAALMQYARNAIRSRWLFEDFSEFAALHQLTNGDWRSVGKMAGEGNSLFLNAGTFREERESGTNRAGWGWAVALFDSDNDCDLDIYAANGWITGKNQDDL